MMRHVRDTGSQLISSGSRAGCKHGNILTLRVQNEQFSEEKGFILRDTESEDIFRRDLNPRSVDYGANSLLLSNLTC